MAKESADFRRPVGRTPAWKSPLNQTRTIARILGGAAVPLTRSPLILLDFLEPPVGVEPTTC